MVKDCDNDGLVKIKQLQAYNDKLRESEKSFLARVVFQTSGG